jgi:hypothetical protein
MMEKKKKEIWGKEYLNVLRREFRASELPSLEKFAGGEKATRII